MASGIVFSGLASGIDSEAIISALSASAKTPINRLQAQKTEFSSQSKKLSDIKTKLAALQTAAKALDSKGEARVDIQGKRLNGRGFWVGKTIHHAYVLLDKKNLVTFASNAVAVTIVR